MKITKTLAAALFVGLSGVVMAAQPAQEVVLQPDEGGANLTVVTNDDGTVSVITADGRILTGQAALNALQAAGVQVQVNPLGSFTGVQGAKVVKPATKVAPATSQKVQQTAATQTQQTTQTTSSTAVVMPTNTASSTAYATSAAASATTTTNSAEAAASAAVAAATTESSTNLNVIVERVAEGKESKEVLPESVSK